MKYLVLPLFFFWMNILPAQDFQNICSPGITLFRGNDNYFKAFRRDSVVPAGANDTLFFSYRTTRDSTSNPFDCKDTSNGDALGRKVTKMQNGWFYFYNMKGDTLRINSQAALNDSWTYCQLPSNCHLQATVTGMITDSVLGTTDLVKVISFQAKDASNTNVASIFNQKAIKLSQHYGLSKMYDVYRTPFDTLDLYLAGKSSPALGVQLFTWKDVYNFDVGDEFHYHEYQAYNSMSTVDSKFISKILGKTVYGNMDSVYYQVEQCRRTWYPMGNITESHDTVVEKYNFIQLESDATILLPPDLFLGFASVSRTYSAFNNRLVLIYNNTAYSYGGGGQGCITGPFEMWGPVSSFVPGLGLTNWLEEEVDADVSEHTIDLVYYKKGTEVWGTPVATDCFQLVGVDEKPVPAGPPISIYPNPATDEVTIEITGNFINGRLTISDLDGRQLITRQINTLKTQVDISSIPCGVYIVKLTSDNTLRVGKFIKE